MPRQTWQLEDMVAALQSVKADGLSLRAAALTYGIPPSTLRDKFHGRSSPLVIRRGPLPFLSKAEELKIVDWAIKMGRIGLRQTRVDIQNVVKTLLDKDGRENPFVNNTPGNRWWRSFVQRHPNLLYRKQQPTDKARVMVSDQRVEAWFSDFGARLQKERALSMLSEPHRLFDDESESPLDGILSGFSTQLPGRTPSLAQPTPSMSSTVALDGILSGFTTQSTPAQPALSTPSTPSTAAFTAKTPPEADASVSRVEYVVVPVGMSQDQRKKKGLPPEAITVAEFFRYMRARRTRENHEEKVEQRRMNQLLSTRREMEEEEEMDEEEEMEEDEEALLGIREGDGGWKESAITTPQTEQEREERKEQEAERRKKKMEKRKTQRRLLKNKEKINKIMKSANEPDSEVKRRQLKEEKEKARKIKQKQKEEKQKKEKKKRKKASSKKAKEDELERENKTDGLRKETIIEAKDKVRTKSNIKTVDTDEEIYICPACVKSSGDNEKWISCDHCVRWMHLSCTSMHLLRGIDLAGLDYKCKFC